MLTQGIFECEVVISKEFQALLDNATLKFVPYLTKVDPIGCKWVYRTTLKSDGCLDKYKVRIFTKGYIQVEGIDYT